MTMRPVVLESSDQKCPVCKRARSEWRTNSGRGETSGGLTYCCEGCAKGGKCVCELRQAALPPSIDKSPKNEEGHQT